MRWIDDNPYNPRFPFWTRANVSEVLPEPPTPLGWDLVWEDACIAGWRDLFIERCGMDPDEFDAHRPEMVGIYGGYAYLGASFFRVWAGRTPGMKPTTIDEVYFSDHPDVPPYVEEPWHAHAHTTEVMTGWLGWATGDRDQSELEADRAESLRLKAARPDHRSMSDRELIDHAIAQRPLVRRMFNQHINQSLAASVGPGILGAICEAIGEPQTAMRLMAGFGGVDSAAPSYAMWDLGRIVAGSPSLGAVFDAGVHGLDARLRAAGTAEASAFIADFDRFLDEFGSRGPNEWDLVARPWGIAPDGALAAVDRMRLAPETSSPQRENEAREAERLRLTEHVRAALAADAEALGTFEVGLGAASTFLPGRERSKTSIIRVLQEMRLATDELARRAVERSHLDDPLDFYLLFTDEAVEYAEGQLGGLRELVAPRREYREWLRSIEPPFIMVGEPKPNTTWLARGDRSHVIDLVAGETVAGVAGCPGSAEGRARVVLDSNDPTALEPGDILIAPITDPSWTPLFVSAAAVVVDTGAMLSHAVIVSRELGIPCVPSVPDATKRIPDGALIRVDGDAGTVTILALP